MLNSSPSAVSEFKSADSESLWNLDKSIVIGDCTNNSNDSRIKVCRCGFLIFLNWFSFEEASHWINSFINDSFLLFFSWCADTFRFSKDTSDSGNRKWISIQSRLVQSLQYCFIESRCSSTIQERIKLIYKRCTLMRVFKYALELLVVLVLLFFILPPLIRSIAITQIN